MKLLKFALLGILFGIVLTKGEVISWYRIYEMFRFDSFHMFGIIGSAVLVGIGIVQMIRRRNMKSIEGEEIHLPPKKLSVPRYLIGGTLFGLGWALTGACPGPMFILLGQGIWAIGLVILSAVAGTFLYGVLRPYLPH